MDSGESPSAETTGELAEETNVETLDVLAAEKSLVASVESDEALEDSTSVASDIVFLDEMLVDEADEEEMSVDESTSESLDISDDEKNDYDSPAPPPPSSLPAWGADETKTLDFHFDESALSWTSSGKRTRHLGDVLPAEVWERFAWRSEASGNSWIEVDEASMRDLADELLFYHAGTRLSAALLDRLTEACSRCVSCGSCARRDAFEAGTRPITARDLAVVSKRTDWGWFSHDLRKSVRDLDARRLVWMAHKKWTVDKLKVVEPRLELYSLPPRLRDEAASRLLDRTLHGAAECKNRRDRA
jgi:hypothetical protein